MPAKTEFYVRRRASPRLGRYLFERNGEFGWGPKRIATKFRGSIDAERAACLIGKRNGARVELVHA